MPEEGLFPNKQLVYWVDQDGTDNAFRGGKLRGSDADERQMVKP